MINSIRDKYVGNCVVDILRFFIKGVSGEVAAPILIEKYGLEVCYRAIFHLEDLFCK